MFDWKGRWLCVVPGSGDIQYHYTRGLTPLQIVYLLRLVPPFYNKVHALVLVVPVGRESRRPLRKVTSHR